MLLSRSLGGSTAQSDGRIKLDSNRNVKPGKNLFRPLDVKKKVPKKKLPERDLPAKYFGEYLDPNENFSFFKTQ